METASKGNLSNSGLISLLACPECGCDLLRDQEDLICSLCDGRWEIRDGIPLIYPRHMDVEHLEEEESLARMMKSPRLNRKEIFSSQQWRQSKMEFWRAVEKNMHKNPGTWINIGCGYDSAFAKFERQGHTFVNFDLVFDILRAQQQENGAMSCVGGDVSSFPFKKGSFDYVVCIDVIHHESDRLKSMLISFMDLLKPGGRLFIEDVNAWGMFQIPKSVMLPRPVYRKLRSFYHRIKKSDHRPADYEFPTSVWSVKRMLSEIGFRNVICHENLSYPSISEPVYRIYRACAGFDFVRRYFNYHYMISAEKQ